jgi:hypothetical protein
VGLFRDSGLHFADDAEAPLAVARDVDAALWVTAEGRRAATRAGSFTLWELKIKFNSLTNPSLITKMDAAGQGHPGLGARLRYRTARLGPSIHMPSMLSHPKYPVEPPALDACSAGHPKRQEFK